MIEAYYFKVNNNKISNENVRRKICIRKIREPSLIFKSLNVHSHRFLSDHNGHSVQQISGYDVTSQIQQRVQVRVVGGEKRIVPDRADRGPVNAVPFVHLDEIDPSNRFLSRTRTSINRYLVVFPVNAKRTVLIKHD